MIFSIAYGAMPLPNNTVVVFRVRVSGAGRRLVVLLV